MRIIYGADYNPEQWSKDVWLEDMKYMKKAKVNMVNLNIFGWALIEPEDGVYDFSHLDYMMDLLYENGIDVDLANATAAQPAWLSRKYQDVLPLDQYMNRIWYGSRQTYCPNSPNYIRKAIALTKAIVDRYKKHPALKMWHINNEYSDHVSICYCDNCAQAFRKWLKKRYTLNQVNERWGTAFWSQKYYDFEEIIPPRYTSADVNPGLLLDYKRFMSDAFLSLYLGEYDIIKSNSQWPITSNFMGNDNKPLDYRKWAKHLDLVSWDSYPDLMDSDSPMKNALTHDLMRSLKKKHHIMMEQAPNQVNWRPRNPNKRPGEMEAYSMQSILHGAKGVMFFQWRQSLKGAEKFHSGMIPHGGINTRTFKEVCRLGHNLEMLDTIDRVSRVAIYFDYDTWWALEYEPGPSIDMKYMDRIRDFYAYFYDMNIPIDFVFSGDDFSKYDTIVAPNMYMMKDEIELRSFVKAGGHLILGPFSGIVDESDTVFDSGYLGPLKDVFAIEVSGYNVLTDKRFDTDGCLYGLWMDEFTTSGQVISLTSTNEPLVSTNKYYQGHASYIGTIYEDMSTILCRLIAQNTINSPKDVCIYVDNTTYHVLNMNDYEISFHLIEKGIDICLKPFEYQSFK